MTGQSLCLTCLHHHDGLCATMSRGQWVFPPVPGLTSCPYYIHREPGSSAEAFR